MQALLMSSGEADGYRSEKFSLPFDGNVVLRDGGRLLKSGANANSQDRVRVVDALTGVLSANMYDHLVVDSSSAMLWRKSKGALIASSGPASNGCALSGVENVKTRHFRFGVTVVQHGHQLQVLRFDGEPEPVVERHVSVMSWCVCVDLADGLYCSWTSESNTRARVWSIVIFSHSAGGCRDVRPWTHAIDYGPSWSSLDVAADTCANRQALVRPDC